jgi:hypothetical protein
MGGVLGTEQYQWVLYMQAHGSADKETILNMSFREFEHIIHFLHARARGVFIVNCFAMGKKDMFQNKDYVLARTTPYPIIIHSITNSNSSIMPIVNMTVAKEGSIESLSTHISFTIRYDQFARMILKNSKKAVPTSYKDIIPPLFQVGDVSCIEGLTKSEADEVVERFGNIEERLPSIRYAHTNQFVPLACIMPFIAFTQVMNKTRVKPFFITKPWNNKYFVVLLQTPEITFPVILPPLSQSYIVFVRGAFLQESYIFTDLRSTYTSVNNTGEKGYEPLLRALCDVFYKTSDVDSGIATIIKNCTIQVQSKPPCQYLFKNIIMNHKTGISGNDVVWVEKIEKYNSTNPHNLILQESYRHVLLDRLGKAGIFAAPSLPAYIQSAFDILGVHIAPYKIYMLQEELTALTLATE